MKNIFTILALLFTFAVVVPAQENRCELKLAQIKQPPELYGLRVGMTFEQVKLLVPSLLPGRPNNLGFATTSFSPDFNPQIDKTTYAGVRTISLDFIDNKLFAIWIGFNNSYKWKSLEEFVPGMSSALGFPAGVWKVDSAKPTIECHDFEVAASMIGGGPSIRITDQTAKALWEQRRAEMEEKRSEQETESPAH
jgi:hypothetical protein